jgi:hypothetical protein
MVMTLAVVMLAMLAPTTAIDHDAGITSIVVVVVSYTDVTR